MKKKASDVRQKMTPQEKYGALFEMHTSMLWRQQTMKALTVALFFLALFPSFTSAKEEKWSIVRADIVLISDQRVSDWRASPLKIIDPKLVQAITGLFLETKGRWKKGFATSPSGDIRFIFYRGDHYLDSVGVGNRFMVRGGSGDWESMQISVELEARLRGFSEREPVQPSKTTTRSSAPDPV